MWARREIKTRRSEKQPEAKAPDHKHKKKKARRAIDTPQLPEVPVGFETGIAWTPGAG
jgi:hypothetical protein